MWSARRLPFRRRANFASYLSGFRTQVERGGILLEAQIILADHEVIPSRQEPRSSELESPHFAEISVRIWRTSVRWILADQK